MLTANPKRRPHHLFEEENPAMHASKMLLGFLAIAGILLSDGRTPAEPKPIAPEQFDKLQSMIKPQAGESLFLDIHWLLSVWEARQRAAVEGKPILVWAGAGGPPVAVC
jgi:hypothetical protein